MVMDGSINRVACIGTGVIGRGWIRVFTRAGCHTRIYDPDPKQLTDTLSWLERSLEKDVLNRAISEKEAEAQRDRVSPHTDLGEAVDRAQYIQESGPENVEVKRAIFTEIDGAAGAEAIIASSTSSLDMNDIAGDLPGERRCVLAHPFNPPNIIPVVEVMPCRGTNPEVTDHAMAFLTRVGQKPVLMKRYAVGYIMNRIQAAVVREVVNTVASGLADVEAVDTIIRDGLALRWVLLGNFGTNNTNADGGIREYYTRYGRIYQSIIKDLDPSPPSFDPGLVEEIGRQVDAMEGSAAIEDICHWRDQMVLKLRALKEKNPHP